MPEQTPLPPDNSASSRRDFLKTGTVAGLAGSLLANFAGTPRAFAAGDDVIRVGLVGCGGRGTGAANQALTADPQTRLVAMGDAFEEELHSSLKTLKAQDGVASQIDVDDDHKFVGLNAFKQVVDACDVVLLASPPGFRPQHIAYAVEQGKHIFTEKPMATDIAGAKSVMESVKRSKEKGIAMVAGFCWRYDYPRRALFERVHNGEIGDVICVYGTYLTSPVKPMPAASTRPSGMSDLEWMVRNWYNFTWLSGDGLVEQACHTVDWLAWAKGDQSPASCTAVGGRQIPALGGNIYDHIEVNYLWGDDTRSFIAQRQIPGCYNENSLSILGSKGQGHITPRGVYITGESKWKYRGESPNMYQVEHNEMFKSIRDGKPINDGDRMINSTIMAIMGRMAAYSGKQLTWEEALATDQKLVPDANEWSDPAEMRDMAMPGLTSL